MSNNLRHGSRSSRFYNRNYVYHLSLSALFVSLSIILTRFASITPLPSLRIGFGAIPIQIAGILLGPIWGAVVGFVADPLGFILNPQGTYHLGFGLSSVLNGLLPGLLTKFIERRYSSAQALNQNAKDRIKPANRRRQLIIISILTTTLLTLLCSILLNTLWLSQILGTAYRALLITRLPAVLVTAVVHCLLLLVILPTLDRINRQR